MINIYKSNHILLNMLKNLIASILIGSFIGKLEAQDDIEIKTFRRMHLFLEYDRLFNIFLNDEYYLEMIRPTQLQLNSFIMEKGLVRSKNVIERRLKFDDIFLRAITSKYEHLIQSCNTVSIYFLCFGFYQINRLVLIIKDLLQTVGCNAYNKYLEDILQYYESLNLENELKYRMYVDNYEHFKTDDEIAKLVITNDRNLVKNVKSIISFFERLIRPADTSAEETDIDEMVKQTTELWEIAIKLSGNIKILNQLVKKNDDINEFGKKTEVFQSLQMEILRDIEARKFSISAKRDIPKTGLTEFFLQMIVNVKGDVVKEGTSDSQRFSFAHCDIFYVLRPHYKLNRENAGSVEPLTYSDDETANFGFLTEN